MKLHLKPFFCPHYSLLSSCLPLSWYPLLAEIEWSTVLAFSSCLLHFQNSSQTGLLPCSILSLKLFSWIILLLVPCHFLAITHSSGVCQRSVSCSFWILTDQHFVTQTSTQNNNCFQMNGPTCYKNIKSCTSTPDWVLFISILQMKSQGSEAALTVSTVGKCSVWET